jgi:flavorubredoxin
MKNKAQITQAVKQIFRHQQGLHDPQIMHPYRDWLIGLSVAVVIFVISIGISISTYTKNKNSGEDLGESGGVDVVQYRESQVNEALEKFSAREQVVIGIVGIHSEEDEVSSSTASTTIEIATSSSSATTSESINPTELEIPLIETSGGIEPGF